MKNVFFAFAFLLVGTFAFANNAEVECLTENVACETIPSEATAELEEGFACFEFTLSCGETSYSCGYSLGEIIDFAMWADDYICG